MVENWNFLWNIPMKAMPEVICVLRTKSKWLQKKENEIMETAILDSARFFWKVTNALGILLSLHLEFKLHAADHP